MPFAVVPAYEHWRGAIWIVTRPPVGRVNRPSCTAAAQTELSSV